MLKNLYIMDENGRLLYSKDFVREQKYDDNLLVGFFTSITNFSREALGTAVKNIDLGENNKLIIIPKQEESLLGAAIVSSNDNNELVAKILKNILREFIDSYAPDYDIEKIIQEEMEKNIQSILKGALFYEKSPIHIKHGIDTALVICAVFRSITEKRTVKINYDEMDSERVLALVE